MMRILSLILLLTTMVMVPVVDAQSPGNLRPYTARYNAKYKGVSGGDIEFTLKNDGAGKYTYQSRLLPNFLGSFLTSDRAIDSTQVMINGSLVQPLHFHSEDGSSATEKDLSYDFDWSRNQVKGRYKNADFTMELPQGVQDRLSIQLAAMVALQGGHEPTNLTMLEKNELQEYDVIREGNAHIRVAAGEFDTLVLRTERKDSNRNTRYWYAAKLGYIPVRAERSTKGKPDILMELKSIKFQ